MNFYKPAGRCFLLLALSIAIHSCKTASKDDTENIKINPAFELDPPVAEDVFVKKIKGDDKNLLVVGKFTQGQLKEKFLAFNYDSAKLVMRDDGKGGDEKEGDGLYSVKVNTSPAEFEKDITAMQKGSTGKRFVYNGRSIVSEMMIKPFDVNRFKTGELVSIRHLPGPPPPPSVNEHSLMITDLSVVEDPARTWNFCTQTGNIDGPWTFKTLMKNLAMTSPSSIVTDVQLSDFVEHFFSSWIGASTVNGELVNGRHTIDRMLQSWRARSQVLPLPRVPRGKLDMRAVPFRLLAIVNRLDLRGNLGYGNSKSGEARFVFCMLSTNGCDAFPFNIIFEYGISKKPCPLKAYAEQWLGLSDIPFTAPEFNIQLQAITDQFTLCGTSTGKPNQSSLNQLRSNELALGVVPWELREFHLDNTTHLLEPAMVKQTPAVKYNAKLNNADVQLLAAYINSNEPAILANNFTIPATYSGNDFLGGHALTGRSTLPLLNPVGTPSGIEPFHWNGVTASGPAFINSNDARQIISLNTCSGCHGGETQTSFTMVDPQPYGIQATLSGFLTGTPGVSFNSITPVDLDGPNGIMNVPDPAGRASSNSIRRFNDLQRRADDLVDLITGSCRPVLSTREILMRRTPKFVH